jgi:tetratricopeptide (TPR) repeat protein
MAIVQAGSGDQNAALASYRHALQLLREIGMEKEVGDTLMDMGSLLSEMGQTDQALQAYQEALKTQRESGDENFESLCLNNIANVYVARGDTGNAFTYFQQALQLREKLAVPTFLADTLFGMGKAYTLDGQYEEAIKVLVRAVDLARKADDQNEVALISHQMGVVFASEGRFGAAINSMQDALKGLRAANDKSKHIVEVQSDLASALAAAGRNSDAEPALDGADSIAHTLKSQTLLAKLANTRGDIALYRGDAAAAAKQFQQALQAATASKDASVIAASHYNLARTAIAQGHARETVAALTSLNEKTETLPRLLAVRISTALAEALIQTQALPRARQSLLTDLGDAEKSGMKPEIARIYYLLSIIAKDGNNTGDAVSYSRQALKALDAMQAEPGSNSVLQRADLKEIYKACTETAAAH